MLIRIVHMHFTKEHVEKFLEIFKESAEAIQAMEGCRHLELLRDLQDDCHFTTISEWDTADHLTQYRESDLFRSVWGRVKPMFDQKPRAHSMSPAVAGPR
ncbi:MAG: antibiotic biosynthesis monooxygenase family protein [Chryseolinea sp.]